MLQNSFAAEEFNNQCLTRFDKISPHLDNFLTVYFLSGKMLSLLWQIWYIIALIFIVANCQILKNTLTIWSHLF